MTTTASIPDGATLLGAIDGWEYLAVEWVYRRPIGAGLALDYYCTRSAWPETPAAQLAGRDQIITDLRAQVAELEARLAETTVPPSVAAAATGMPAAVAEYTCMCGRRCASFRGLKTHQRLAHSEHSAEPVECPACHKTFKNTAGLAVHRPNCPAAGPALIPIANEAPQIVPDVGDGWRCERCGSDAFAPGLRSVAICMKCEQIEANGNGVHV
jgi:hypothetical protein